MHRATALGPPPHYIPLLHPLLTQLLLAGHTRPLAAEQGSLWQIRDQFVLDQAWGPSWSHHLALVIVTMEDFYTKASSLVL